MVAGEAQPQPAQRKNEAWSCGKIPPVITGGPIQNGKFNGILMGFNGI